MDIDLSFRPNVGLPYAEHARIRARGPVVWSDALAGWVVSSYAEVKHVLSDLASFTSEGTPIGEAFGAEAMLVDDTLLHHTMRAVWTKQVSTSALAARANELELLAARLLEPLAVRLKAGETVNIAEVFQQFVAEVIALMFQVSRARLDDLKRWNRMFSDTPALELTPGSAPYDAHLAAKAEVYDFLHQEMSERRQRLLAGEQLDDLVSLMVAAEGRNGITRSIAVDNLMNFFLGALETTAKWLGNIVVVLTGHSDVLEEIRARRNFLPQAIEEVMRLETVAQILVRLVKKDGVRLAGEALKENDRVYVLLGVANRDPLVFDDGGSFNMHRIAKPHLGFGYGMHQCLGAATARQEALSFTNAWLDMIPDIEVVQCDYGTSWAVWGPRALHIRSASAGR